VLRRTGMAWFASFSIVADFARCGSRLRNMCESGKDGSGTTGARKPTVELAGLWRVRDGGLPLGNGIFLWQAGSTRDGRRAYGAVPISLCQFGNATNCFGGAAKADRTQESDVDPARDGDAAAFGGFGDSHPVFAAV